MHIPDTVQAGNLCKLFQASPSFAPRLSEDSEPNSSTGAQDDGVILSQSRSDAALVQEDWVDRRARLVALFSAKSEVG